MAAKKVKGPVWPTNPDKRTLEKVVNAVKRNKNNRVAAAKELGIKTAKFKRYMWLAEKAGIPIPPPFDPKDKVQPHSFTDAELHDAWSLYERYNYNASAAAEAVGLKRNAFDDRIKRAIQRFNYTKKSLGVTHAAAAKKLSLPKGDVIKRYILTCAQNNTVLHEPTWAALMNIANHYAADIKVATFTYIGSEGSEKRGREKKATMGRQIEDRWYDDRVVPFISDDFEQLAPGLVWCGNMNILPTASDPLRGMENLNGRNSAVFPHPRIEMRPVATTQGDATKFNWTTGSVTLRNYIQKRSAFSPSSTTASVRCSLKWTAAEAGGAVNSTPIATA